MEMKNFAAKTQKAMEKILTNDAEVKIQEVHKNNGVVLHGLRITPHGGNLAPTIYLEDFFRMYEQGVTFQTIIDNILEVYKNGSSQNKIDMEFFKDFESVKDRIVYKIVNADKNKTLLEQIPYIPFLDLAICFYYAYSSKELGKGSILIHNSHLEMWETNTENLMTLAQRNAPRLFRPELKSMGEVLGEMVREQFSTRKTKGYDSQDECIEDKNCGECEFCESLPMYILSNSSRVYGAACILYKGLLQEIAEDLSSSFYILPSSVHEVILLKDSGNEKPEELRQIISEVNENMVSQEELLSDALYYYNRTEKQIKIIL